MLTPDVRFEGWTTEDWVRFVRLWQPRATPDREPTRPRGGVVCVHEDGQILKLVHTIHGRLDIPAESTAPETPGATALTLRTAQPSALQALVIAHRASWAASMRLGALDEVMERFGARARRKDDFTSQALQLVLIVREMIDEGAITLWPSRLRGLPVPTPQVVRRAVDALCPDGRAIALGLFDHEGLWTSFVARRRDGAFDVIAGPDELRPALGLLSGDWRRDYRHFARAVEDRYGPLAFGCYAEVTRFRALQTDPHPGAWTRAAAVRDVILAPMPLAVGVGLGFDGARYAFEGLRLLTGRIAPWASIGPVLDGVRSRVAKVTGKDVGALLGFDPMAALRALLER